MKTWIVLAAVAVVSALVSGTVVKIFWPGGSVLPRIPTHDEEKRGYYLMDGALETALLTSLGNPNNPITEEDADANGGKRAGAMNWIAVELKYVDPNGRVWLVPRNVANDGASVPPLLESFVTGGLNTHARYAAIVHDHYCDLLARPNAPAGVTYAQVHEMFYHAMRSSNVDARLAGIMYTAVEMFGPPKSRSLWTRVLENLTLEERKRLNKALQGEEALAAAVVITQEAQGHIAVSGMQPPPVPEAPLSMEHWTVHAADGRPLWTSPNRVVLPTTHAPMVVAIDEDWNYAVMHPRPMNHVTDNHFTSSAIAFSTAPKEADQFRKIVAGIEKAETVPDLGKVKEMIKENTEPAP
jgi:hypothetical protein